MKRRFFAMFVAALFGCAVARAQASGEDWVGIWQANVGGQPASTLTLAGDTGELGGTLVLDMIGDEGGQPHVIASEPHVLMNLRVDGDTLKFQVKMRPPDGVSRIANFEVKRTAADKATVRCVSCGTGAPAVELARGL
jgi:hypothetical protein